MNDRGHRVLQALLGPEHEGHPSSRELVAFAEGLLEANERLEIHRHLSECAECEKLLAAAHAGLDELVRLEAKTGGAKSSTLLPARLHSVARIAPPPPPRLLAATPLVELPPWPEARRVLLERMDPPFRIVLFRVDVLARVGLYSSALERFAEIDCSLDEEHAPPASTSPEGISFSIGPVDSLLGKTLHLTLMLDGVCHHLSWTLVEDGEP